MRKKDSLTSSRTSFTQCPESSLLTTTTIDELVIHLIQQNTTAAAVGERGITTRLVHIDLPKLAASGVIDYDEQDNTIQYHGGTTLEEAVAYAAHLEHECQ